jgi:hypothetical protein
MADTNKNNKNETVPDSPVRTVDHACLVEVEPLEGPVPEEYVRICGIDADHARHGKITGRIGLMMDGEEGMVFIVHEIQGLVYAHRITLRAIATAALDGALDLHQMEEQIANSQ